MACAGHDDGVVHQEAPAHGVAGDVEAGHGVLVGVEGAALRVAVDAADDHEHARVAEGHGVAGRVLHGEQARGHLAEVYVPAVVRQLVVALDSGVEGIEGHADLLGELLQGVGRDDAAGVDLALEVGVARVPGGEVVDGVLVPVLILRRDVVRHAAEALRHVLQLLLPLAVEDLVGDAALLALDLVLQLLGAGVLVGEALAILVDHEEGVDADGVGSQAVRHGGVGAVLHGRARPQGHLVAVAGVHHVAVAVEAAEELAVAQRLRGVVGEHLTVAGDVARGEDDAPRGVDEDGVAALVGGVDARHAAGLVLGELLGAAVEEGLRAGRLGGLE